MIQPTGHALWMPSIGYIMVNMVIIQNVLILCSSIFVSRDFAPILLEKNSLFKEAQELREIPDNISYRKLKKLMIACNQFNTLYSIRDIRDIIDAAIRNASKETGFKTIQIIIRHCIIRDTREWDKYFKLLDELLAAGKTGEPWSADAIETGVTKYKIAANILEMA
jgi:hypothetical protein